jgi:hypothetical protein
MGGPTGWGAHWKVHHWGDRRQVLPSVCELLDGPRGATRNSIRGRRYAPEQVVSRVRETGELRRQASRAWPRSPMVGVAPQQHYEGTFPVWQVDPV